MRVSFLILAVLLLITGVTALTNHEQIIEKQLEIRKANVERINLPIVVSMDAARGYIQTLGQSTVTLKDIENSYKESITNIRDEATDTHFEMNELVDESKALVNTFKSELVFRLNSGGGNQARLTSIVAIRILENGLEINRLNEEFWNIRETNSLDVFDLQLIIGENFIEWFEERGYDTNELNAKKKEIYYMRAVLLQAIQSRNEAAIQDANDRIALLAKEWFEIGKRLLMEGPSFCAQDVFTCPDGSAVGRDPRNNCEFYPCPVNDTIVRRVCTQDVFTCPDGSAVGRDPRNNCEFYPCPVNQPPVRVCTQDVFTCPDGSAVGRDPRNNCEFYPCLKKCQDDVRQCPNLRYMRRNPRLNCQFDPCPTIKYLG